MNHLSFIQTEVGKKTVNVASVPQLSPFRYPGGKTWLVPIIRKWFDQDKNKAQLLVEPFVGGGIVSLTAASEKRVKKILMTELDPEIAAVWRAILGNNNDWLSNRILNFDLNLPNAIKEIERKRKTDRDVAFSTIIKNRTYHGGILAKGSGFLKHGEAGKGIRSRWYPETLYKRIQAIKEYADIIEFEEADAFETIKKYKNSSKNWFFIDPPYTKAGKRLYTFYDIDHHKLLELTSKIKGRYLLTYDDSKEIRKMANELGLKWKLIPMRTTHHLTKMEILISDNFDWL